MIVTTPNGTKHRIEVVSTPRSEGMAFNHMRQRLQRLMRDNHLQ